MILINFLRSDINVGRNEDIIVTKKYESQIDETEGDPTSNDLGIYVLVPSVWNWAYRLVTV